MAVVAAVVGAVVTTALQIKEQKKAADAADDAADLQAQQGRAEAIRAKRKQLSQARLQRARVTNVGAQVGATGSSAVEGALSSVSTRSGVNVSFLDQSLARSNSIFELQSDVRAGQRRAGLYGQAAGLFTQGAFAGISAGEE